MLLRRGSYDRLTLLLLLALGAEAARAQFGGPALVSVTPVEARRLRATVTLVGTVSPNIRSTLGAEEPGIVQALPVREGDLVEKGQLICRLNSDILREDLAEAKHRLASLQQTLGELVAGTRKEDIAQLEAAVRGAQAGQQQWDFERKRVQGLFDQRTASDTELNNTLAAAGVADSRLDQARARLLMARNGPRKEQIDRARADVGAQKAAVARLTRRLEKKEIKAPFAGFVSRLDTEVGQWVTQGGDIVELVDLASVLARVDMPEMYIDAVKPGQEATVWIEALGREFQGHVARVVPQASLKARTFPVEVGLPNADHRIKPGMSVDAKMAAGKERQTLLVPKDAIVSMGPARTVFVARDTPKGKMAFPVTVRVGVAVDDLMTIETDQIKPGENVIVRGNERLVFAPGPSPITVAPTTAKGKARAATSRPAS